MLNIVQYNLIRVLTLTVMLLIGFQTAFSQTEVKLNAATALFLVPNLGIELPLGKRQSIQLDVLGSFWDEMPLLNNTPLHVSQTFLEYRWYRNSNREKWFVAPHIGFGVFTLQKPKYLVLYDHYAAINGGSSRGDLPNDDSYQSGRIAFYGLTVGFKKRLNQAWALEAFLGAGLSQSKYRGYQGYNRVDHLSELPEVRPFNGSGEVLLYRGGIMVVYTLPAVSS